MNTNRRGFIGALLALPLVGRIKVPWRCASCRDGECPNEPGLTKDEAYRRFGIMTGKAREAQGAWVNAVDQTSPNWRKLYGVSMSEGLFDK